MEIRLSPELAAVVEQDVAAGRFASAEEYIAAAVELLHERERGMNGETPEEFNAKLEESIAQAERGEVADEEQVREEMRQMKAEWTSSKKTA
jgi:putative addiction module CopG family antidote